MFLDKSAAYVQELDENRDRSTLALEDLQSVHLKPPRNSDVIGPGNRTHFYDVQIGLLRERLLVISANTTDLRARGGKSYQSLVTSCLLQQTQGSFEEVMRQMR